MKTPDMPMRLTAVHIGSMFVSIASAIAVPVYTTATPPLKFVKTVFDDSNNIVLQYVGQIPPYTFPVICFLISALYHAFCLLFTTLYVRLSSSIAWHRWISFSICFPLTFTTVAYSVGITDQAAIAILCVSIFQAVCVNGIFHDIARLHNQPRIDSISLSNIGFLFSIVPIFNAHLTYQQAPPFTSALLAFSTICIFAISCIPLLSDYRKEKSPYTTSEYLYVGLSNCLFLSVGHIFSMGIVSESQ